MSRAAFPNGSLFSSLGEAQNAVGAALADAMAYARRECGRGCLQSRGRWIVALRDGQIVAGEAESWEWDGTLRSLVAAVDEARFGHRADALVLQGGVNWAASPRDFVSCENYEPWVADWAVTVWRKPE